MECCVDCSKQCCICFNMSTKIWPYRLYRIISSDYGCVRIEYTLVHNVQNISTILFCYSWPWNEECFIGYVGEILTVIIMSDVVLAVVIQSFLLFISICVHIFTFNEIFASFVNELNASIEEEKKTDNFRKLLRFHMDIKGCVCEIKTFVQF